jgi:hypothetical protein
MCEMGRLHYVKDLLEQHLELTQVSYVIMCEGEDYSTYVKELLEHHLELTQVSHLVPPLAAVNSWNRRRRQL